MNIVEFVPTLSRFSIAFYVIIISITIIMVLMMDEHGQGVFKVSSSYANSFCQITILFLFKFLS
jgi:hypothetical protein